MKLARSNKATLASGIPISWLGQTVWLPHTHTLNTFHCVNCGGAGIDDKCLPVAIATGGKLMVVVCGLHVASVAFATNM